MTESVATCHVNDALYVAARAMWDRDCGALPVVNDEGVVTGMITDRDICMAAYTQGRRLDEMLVNSAMAHKVVTVGPDTSINEAEQLMARYQIRRLPVVDDNGRPIGLISLNDIAIESAQPDTRLNRAPHKLAHTLAAICRPAVSKIKAA